MRHLVLITLFFFAQNQNVFGQFDCANLDFLGIYYNNRNTNQLSLLMTNTGMEDDGNNMPYTTFHLINDAGDTILTSGPVFQLPNSVEDTIVYNVPLHDDYRHIYELPDYRCGRLIMKDPSCEINYCFDTIPEVELPETPRKDCDDFEIVGIYETANGGALDYSVILTNNNRDSARAWDLGYTNFQFFDRWGEEVSVASGPSFIVPMQYGDTIIVHLDFNRKIEDGEVLLLRMTNPDCTIPYISSTIVGVRSLDEPIYKVSPNPASDIIHLKTEGSPDRWVLSDLSGKVIRSGTGKMIDISGFSSGTYLLKIEWQNITTTEMIVKH